MKKHLFALFSTLFLIFLTSCSALLDNYSSVSVQLPDGLSKQLNFSREEYQQEPITGDNTNPDNPVEHSYSFISCTLEVIGDYQTSITNTYDSIDDINGSTISVSNIPVNSKVEVLLTLKCIRDGVPIGGFYGKSKAVTIVKGNNYVDLTLKPATTIDLGLDTDLVIEIYANGKRYTNEVPYADMYEIKLRKGMRYLNVDVLECKWKINNIECDYIHNNGDNTFGLELINFLYNKGIEEESYILSCYIPENMDYGTSLDSAYIEFNIVDYPDTLIWDYSDGSNYKFVNLNNLLQNKINNSGWTNGTLPNIVIGRNETFYQEESEIYRMNSSGRKSVYSGGFAYPHSYDFENRVLFIGNDGSFQRLQYPYEEEADPITPPDDLQIYDIDLITDKYILEFGDNVITSVYYNSGSEYVKEDENISLDEYPELDNMLVEDRILIGDTLYLLYSKEFGDEDSHKYYQQGVLVSLNLKTKKMKIVGYSDSETEYSGAYNANITVVGLQENNKTAFFEPIRFVAIKDDELYIADHGRIFENTKADDENGKIKGCSRIVGVDLKTFAINTVTTLDNLKLAELSSVTGFSAE